MEVDHEESSATLEVQIGPVENGFRSAFRDAAARRALMAVDRLCIEGCALIGEAR